MQRDRKKKKLILTVFSDKVNFFKKGLKSKLKNENSGCWRHGNGRKNYDKSA